MFQEQTSVPSATGRAFSLHGAKVCKWPILLQKDFAHPSAQD